MFDVMFFVLAIVVKFSVIIASFQKNVIVDLTHSKSFDIFLKLDKLMNFELYFNGSLSPISLFYDFDIFFVDG
jgi:hypothetical protein